MQYTTIHNFKGNFYNRNKGFKNLGYDTFTSVEYMNGLEYTALNWPKDYILTNYMKKALDSTNRNKGFKNLGYDTFTSVEYMNGLEYTALNWPKDYILTNYMKKALDSTEGKDFITTVSVQGHSSYPTEKIDENYPCKVTGDIDEKYKNQIYYYCEHS